MVARTRVGVALRLYSRVSVARTRSDVARGLYVGLDLIDFSVWQSPIYGVMVGP